MWQRRRGLLGLSGISAMHFTCQQL